MMECLFFLKVDIGKFGGDGASCQKGGGGAIEQMQKKWLGNLVKGLWSSLCCSCNFSVGFKLFFKTYSPPKDKKGGRSIAVGPEEVRENKWNQPVSACVSPVWRETLMTHVSGVTDELRGD